MTKEKVLVITAHPDDVDFSCSGTMIIWSRSKEIYYAVCTSGDKGNHIGKTKKEIIKMREDEQREAAKIAGVKEVIFLREPDGELENTKRLREKIVKLIREVKPDILFTFDPSNNKFDQIYKYHPDHRAVGMAVYDSIYPAIGNKNFFPHHIVSEGLKPHEVKEIYFYGSDYPNFWVDITKIIDKKIKTIMCHKSQFGNRKDIGEFVKLRHSEMAKKGDKKMQYAECFRKLEMPR